MIKPAAAIVGFLAAFIAVTVCTTSARAQTEIVAQVPPADYSFGQAINFHLKAIAPTTITQVELFFSVQGQTGHTAVPIVFEPDSTVDIDHPFSLAEHYIPPFATVRYWWRIEDESGTQYTTPNEFLYYADNRYEWQVLRQEHELHKGITWEVYRVEGDVVFGQNALNVAFEALDDLYRELQVPVPGVVRIFIYPSEQDLRSALSLAGYAWAGGQARPELGVVLVGIPDSFFARQEMERLIPHELTHLLVYEAAGREVGRVPPWLNEGLASLHERQPDPERGALVEQALAEGRLIPLRALCAPFPVDESAARLAYAQSASVVYYIREEYGSAKIRDLLAAYADNASCEAGVNRVLGKNLEGLESAWISRLTRRGQLALALRDSSLWLGLWLLTALLALPLLGVIRRSHA